MAEEASSSRTPGPEPIDLYSLGRTPILCERDIEEILKETELDLLPEVDRNAFQYWLNNTVEWTIREQLRIRLQRKILDRLTVSVRTYRDLSRSLLHSEFPPPTLPLDWLADVETWIKKAEKGLDARRSGGASRNVELKVFLPRALGLFHVGFGLEPSTSGATFRFVSAVFSRARKRVDERGFSKRVPRDLRAKARWPLVTDDAIGKRIAAALILQPDVEEGGDEGNHVSSRGELTPNTRKPHGLAWRRHASQFRKMIAMP